MAEQISVSIPKPIYQRIQQFANRRNQPLADALAELLDQSLPPTTELKADEDAAVEREMQAYIALHPMLKQKYLGQLGQHVALYGGKLIDADEDYGALYQRIDAQYPDEFVWLATVEEEAMPTLIFRSPRLLGVA
jgi:hypothetical protein